MILLSIAMKNYAELPCSATIEDRFMQNFSSVLGSLINQCVSDCRLSDNQAKNTKQ